MHLAGFNQEHSARNPVFVLKQSSLRRTGRAGAVLVVRTAMAWAHEQPRLRKPTNGTSEVRAINRKHLEGFPIDISNPACEVCSRSVGRGDDGSSISGEPSLSRRKSIYV